MNKRSILFAVTLLALLAATSLMSACNTVAGAGQDM